MAPMDGSNLNVGQSLDDSLTAFNGANAIFIAEIYERYLQDPTSIDPDWQVFFDAFDDEAASLSGDFDGPSWKKRGNSVVDRDDPSSKVEPINVQVSSGSVGTSAPSYETLRAVASDSVNAIQMIRAYRALGHLHADLDPLGLVENPSFGELDPAKYGFGPGDMEREVFINGNLGLGATAKVRDVVTRLQSTYCGKIGVEFMHIMEPDQKAWLQRRIENIENKTDFTSLGRRTILERLTDAEGFEKFLDAKFKGTKRFGLDGGESTIPALEQIIKRGSQLGIEEVVVGMPHRGRLNILANFMGKPFHQIFAEFQGVMSAPADIETSGDVKYHLGTSTDRTFDDKTVHLSLNPNPSHLEAVNTVVLGKVRAKQALIGDDARGRVMPILLHGDAAFAGQGIVAETLDMSDLRGYKVGGCIHFIINNQIGFTTNPVNARSGPYCTEVAKMVGAPIFHVNGDDPEAVVHAARIAIEFRQEFKQDVIFDLFCYRRFGHNEGDEPAFTQPLMYQKIKSQVTTRALYAERLAAEGLVPAAESEAMVKTFRERMDQEFDISKSFKPNKADWLEGAWQGLKKGEKTGPRRGKTSMAGAHYDVLAKGLTSVPNDFKPNKKVQRLLEQRHAMFANGEGFDWGTAEGMAFGSLLLDGSPIRFTGQDVSRGTFSHRHAAIVDQETERRHYSVNHLTDDQSAFLDIHNSPLSEMGVLGFEYGYSMAAPKALTIWEAQFGDFANGAQVIIDQFITSGEIKWLRMSGLVMLLPHGYEGQGPEHSSARLERYLQQCAEDNIQVANCTTPANYFHILRRQVRRDFRKPLIMMTPKSLLRHKRCVSSKSDFMGDSTFHRIMLEEQTMNDRSKAKRVVFCSGKVYYDLLERRESLEEDGALTPGTVHLVRIEQLYPFPEIALAEEMVGFEDCDLVWCQEEPRNMGAWSFVEPFFEDVFKKVQTRQSRLKYSGRAAAASPATGSAKKHADQQAALIDDAIVGSMN